MIGMAEEIYRQLDVERRQIFAIADCEQPELFAVHIQNIIDADADGLFAEPDSIVVLNDDGDEEVYDAPHCKAAELIVYAWQLVGDRPWFERFQTVIDNAQVLENPYFREDRTGLWQSLKDNLAEL